MVPIKERIVFYEKLEKLISSGNSLEKALQLCQRAKASNSLNQTIKALLKLSQKNLSLERGLKQISQLPIAEKTLLLAAFDSGKFSYIMHKLIHYLEQLINLKKSFLALFLPNFFLLQLAILVLPTISLMTSGGDPIARLLTILPLLATFNTVAFLIYWQFELLLSVLSPFLLHIPLLGTIFKQLELFKFYLLYSQTISAGLSFHHSYRAALSALTKSPLKKELIRAHNAVKHGKTLFPTLYKSKYIPHDHINQWEIGHQSGDEVATLEKMSERSMQDGQDKLKLLSFLLQKFVFALVFVTLFIHAKDMLDNQFKILDELTK